MFNSFKRVKHLISWRTGSERDLVVSPPCFFCTSVFIQSSRRKTAHAKNYKRVFFLTLKHGPNEPDCGLFMYIRSPYELVLIGIIREIAFEKDRNIYLIFLNAEKKEEK